MTSDRMFPFSATLLLCFLASAFQLFAQNPQNPAQAEKPGIANPVLNVDEKPLTSLPYTPSLDVQSMDKSADPCVDFYQYSCGGWMKNNPIPPDQAAWSVYAKVHQDNQRFLWGVLDDLAGKTTGRTPAQQKIGDYFSACMNEPAIEKAGAAPLKASLAQIAALKSKKDLAALLAGEHLQGENGFFGFGSDQDFANSNDVIAFAVAGGLGLPDRDYYTKTDAKSVELRRKYVAHVEKMLRLVGDSPAAAKAEAQTVLRIETALARASLTRVEQRDPHNLFHKMDRKQLQALTPLFDWNAYLSASGVDSVDKFNVTEPKFYQELNRQLQANTLADIKTYLRWHVARSNAPFLSSKFVNENFDFYRRTLRGVQQLPPRWKRCVGLVDEQLGEALGQEFVNRAFSEDMKKRTMEMTRQIEQAMQEDLEQLTWMGPETKKQALEKLHSVVNKVGYPDKWRDYSAVAINRDDFLGNVHRAAQFEEHRQLNKIGKPLDRGEWGMTPPTVNAYYNAQMNDINFPAGVLEPPLYDIKLDDAPNYGNTGATIGHELTHGFDDEGRQFDAKGNLRDWWTKQDAEQFEKRANCVVDQYAKYVIVDDIKINSKLTEGEDVADLGGTILAWIAWKAADKGQKLEDRDGLTPDQRFFVGFAQWACENNRPENLRVSAITNPHSPGKYRINGVVINMPEFQQAFQCKAGQPMVREDRCRVW
ncbi:MAG TPA: M13 family metallopeptidase [Candidatus Limnocylindrales bacterium]|jgi:endothelin-converting enzyme/putative endopeptidase|nr:M13 family metallopeptidase [Candidatus Limnocylindrales bacterium]